jgi:PEP-CTERM motif
MKNWKCFGIVMVIALTVIAVNASAILLQNMELETDLTGWTIGAYNPLGTWDVQWSADHGGSAKMYITGAPAKTSISQVTQIPIIPGDQLTVNVYHSDMGNFSGWGLLIDPGDSQIVISGADGAEGNYSLTWISDRYYDPGTLIVVSCSVWPGSSTTWVENLVYTQIPEPGTFSLLMAGALALLRRKRG